MLDEIENYLRYVNFEFGQDENTNLIHFIGSVGLNNFKKGQGLNEVLISSKSLHYVTETNNFFLRIYFNYSLSASIIKSLIICAKLVIQ